MPETGIFDTTIRMLGKVLDLRTQKQLVISSNIANAETPGYAKISMEFEKQLREEVLGSEAGQAATHPLHMPYSFADRIESFQASFSREKDRNGIGDGNTVSLEQEMVDLSVNQIRFEAAISSLNKKFGMLRHVIQEKF